MVGLEEVLLEAFRAHGVTAVLEGGAVTFPGTPYSATAAIVEGPDPEIRTPLQLDVRLAIGPRRTIVESFGGIGETREEGVRDAFHSFALSSLHVLLTAFFRADDGQVAQEEWLVGGRKARVTVGNVGIRGKPPARERVMGCVKGLERVIQEAPLRPGTHWVRLYYAQMRGEILGCDVLLDNEVWEEVESTMRAADWPSSEEFYSVRLFLVLDVAAGGAVSPGTAVAWLAEILAEQDDLPEDEAIEATVEAGVPEALARRAYSFTQIAWGRALLARLGVEFPPEYYCLDGSGEIVESGLLPEDPCFVEASHLAKRYLGSAAFRCLALASAEMNAVNRALRGGSRPEDIEGTPVYLFLERPTEEGLERAQRLIGEHAATLRERGSARPREPARQAKKPRWRF